MPNVKGPLSKPAWATVFMLLTASLACGIPPAAPPPDQNTLSTIEALQGTVESIELLPNASVTAEADPLQPGKPVSTPVPPPTSAPQGSTQHTLLMINDSNVPVCYLYISPVSRTDWGDDWLGATQIVDVGQYVEYQVDSGRYDMLAMACDETIMDEKYDVSVQADMEWIVEAYVSSGLDQPQPQPPSSSGEVTLTIVNDTPETVCYVWIGEPYSEWIADLLDTNTLAGYSSIDVLVFPGTWALQAEDCAGAAIQTTSSIDIYGPTVWHINPTSAGTVTNTCGNGVCDGGETVFTCDYDCGFCGDGLCTVFENGQNCPEECGPSCGQGTCDPGEDAFTCPLDCGYCGDGYCSPDEDYIVCPVDCP